MSSTRKQGAPAGKGKAPVERRPAKPIFTPLNVGIVLVIIILGTVGFFWKSIYIAKSAEIDTVNGQIEAQKRQNEVYQKKAEMLPKAEQIKSLMITKLDQEQKYFLKGQEDLMFFFGEWFLDVLMGHGIYTATVEIEPKIKFKVSYAASPIETLPPLSEAIDLFEWEYIGEGTGDGTVSTKMPEFLSPLTITITEFFMTYEEMKKFVWDLQRDSTYFVTVHGFRNTGGDDNQYGFRTTSKYEIIFTVYFINPEGTTSGEAPPGMPKDRKL